MALDALLELDRSSLRSSSKPLVTVSNLCLVHVAATTCSYSTPALFTAEGHVKLADLGASKRIGPRLAARDSGSPTRRNKEKIGTDSYLPPEQWSGRGRSAAGDLWALGVLTHELLLGEPGPFGHDEGASPSRLKLRAQIAGGFLCRYEYCLYKKAKGEQVIVDVHVCTWSRQVRARPDFRESKLARARTRLAGRRRTRLTAFIASLAARIALDGWIHLVA